MEATYRLKPYELTDGFFKMVDETAYLLRLEANRKLLLAGVEAVQQGKTVHTMTLEEAEALAT